MEKPVSFNRIKCFIYSLCIVSIYYIECVKTNGTNEDAAIALNCLGFCIFPFVAFRFKLISFLKLPYFIYAVIGAVLIPVVYHFLAAKDALLKRLDYEDHKEYIIKRDIESLDNADETLKSEAYYKDISYGPLGSI